MNQEDKSMESIKEGNLKEEDNYCCELTETEELALEIDILKEELNSLKTTIKNENKNENEKKCYCKCNEQDKKVCPIKNIKSEKDIIEFLVIPQKEITNSPIDEFEILDLLLLVVLLFIFLSIIRS